MRKTGTTFTAGRSVKSEMPARDYSHIRMFRGGRVKRDQENWEFKPHYLPKEQIGFGIHFTPDRSFAERYALDDDVARGSGTPMLYEATLDIHNPLDARKFYPEGSIEFQLAKRLSPRAYVCKDEHDVRQIYMAASINLTSPKRAERILQEMGYDSVIYDASIINRHLCTPGYGRIVAKAVSYVVFNPLQIHLVAQHRLKEKTERSDLPSARFLGTCVGNPFRDVDVLTDVIDRGREITQATFLKNVDIEPDEQLYGYSLQKQMREYPNDFAYFVSSWKGHRIYYFTHSAIEYFYGVGL